MMIYKPFSFSILISLLGGLATTTHAQSPSQWHPAPGPLSTKWAKQVSPKNVLPEYPRPTMTRTRWQNLNGLWDYALSNKEATEAPATYIGQILVPYPFESALSGVGKKSTPDNRLWYRRTFTVPAAWKDERVLLHFGAVNWDSSVSVNGKLLATHRGGYDGFSVDITGSLKSGENETNEVVVSASNPLRSDVPNAQVLGKQRVKPGGIFYTGATGIWQTVWLEPVPTASISALKITPNLDTKTLKVTASLLGEASGAKVLITLLDGKKEVAQTTSAPNTEASLSLSSPHVWTPEDPHLYSLKVALMKDGKALDSVGSYAAMRKISLGKDARGHNRILLNNQFVFQIGALDQGYWPDGIYTAPTDSALKFDIEAAKKFGFNLLRKHAKVEPERWYYWTDKLGVIVWQDMPQAFDDHLSAESKTQFETELRALIAGRHNHPSIVMWVPFNEGWGQHDTPEVVSLIKSLDPSRLVSNASGWNDFKGVGDIVDTHAYPGPWSEIAEPTRAAVNGEFGGVTMRVPGHMWTEDVFGYGATLKDGQLVTKRYQALMKRAYALREERGTSAFVYTQLTDVEQESNGLLTYDRAIIKPDTGVTRDANLGKFPPLAPNPNPDPLPTSAERPAQWLYTTTAPGTDWFTLGVPETDWQKGVAGFGSGVGEVHTEWKTSDIWLRREFTLSANLPSKLAFSAFHDEDMEIYINGVLAGTAKGYSTDYVTVPMTEEGRKALKPGKNLIAVHCHQTVGGQFIDVGIVRQ